RSKISARERPRRDGFASPRAGFAKDPRLNAGLKRAWNVGGKATSTPSLSTLRPSKLQYGRARAELRREWRTMAEECARAEETPEGPRGPPDESPVLRPAAP